MLQDLLRPENENLQIRESETGVFVAGVHEKEVKGMEDCLHLLQLGERNRSCLYAEMGCASCVVHAVLFMLCALHAVLRMLCSLPAVLCLLCSAC